MSILDSLSSGGGDTPIFKFSDPGGRITGLIVEEPKVLPLREFGSEEPKLDAAGNPVTQVLLVLATEELQSDDHDGKWRVFIDKPLMKQAVFDAVKDANAVDILVGDEISIEFVGMKVLKNGRSAKDFTAKFSPATEPDPWSIGAAELGETVDVEAGDT